MKLNSFNNRFILEPYQGDRTIKSTTGSGFAMIAQKVSLKPLKLLADFDGIVNGAYLSLPAGNVVYVREELLYSQPWAKQLMESEGIEGKFIIVESQFIEMIGRT